MLFCLHFLLFSPLHFERTTLGWHCFLLHRHRRFCAALQPIFSEYASHP